MLSLRCQLGYPQSKVAAILGIVDKSFKKYELETGELPLSIAVKFFKEFDNNLIWLIHGTSVPDSERQLACSRKLQRQFLYTRMRTKSPFPAQKSKSSPSTFLSNHSQRAHRRKAEQNCSFHLLDKASNLMKHLKDYKRPINKFANTLRLMGILLPVASTSGFILYRSETGNFWDLYTLFLLQLAVAGAIFAFLGVQLWKILIRNSDVSCRKFYFYYEE